MILDTLKICAPYLRDLSFKTRLDATDYLTVHCIICDLNCSPEDYDIGGLSSPHDWDETPEERDLVEVLRKTDLNTYLIPIISKLNLSDEDLESVLPDIACILFMIIREFQFDEEESHARAELRSKDATFLKKLIELFKFETTRPFARDLFGVLVANKKTKIDLRQIDGIEKLLGQLKPSAQFEFCQAVALSKDSMNSPQDDYIRVTSFRDQNRGNQTVWLDIPSLIPQIVLQLNTKKPDYVACFTILQEFLKGSLAERVREVMIEAGFVVIMRSVWRKFIGSAYNKDRIEYLKCLASFCRDSKYKYVFLTKPEFNRLPKHPFHKYLIKNMRGKGKGQLTVLIRALVSSPSPKEPKVEPIYNLLADFLYNGRESDKKFLYERLNIKQLFLHFLSPHTPEGTFAAVARFLALLLQNAETFKSFATALREEHLGHERFVARLAMYPVLTATLLRTLLLNRYLLQLGNFQVDRYARNLLSEMEVFKHCILNAIILEIVNDPTIDVDRSALLCILTSFVLALKQGKLKDSLIFMKYHHDLTSTHLEKFTKKLLKWREFDFVQDVRRIVVERYVSFEDVRRTVTRVVVRITDVIAARRFVWVHDDNSGVCSRDYSYIRSP